MVRRKGGFDPKRLKKDKVYERSRETTNEFGNCSRAGKLIRMGLSNAASKGVIRCGYMLLAARLGRQNMSDKAYINSIRLEGKQTPSWSSIPNQVANLSI